MTQYLEGMLHGVQPLTVDDLEVAQFIHLLLTNRKIRNVVHSVTSKAVLILGRFSERQKPVLDALHTGLRDSYNLVPIYVRSFPARADSEEVKISDGGGNDIMWSRTRNEILFRTLASSTGGRIMVAPYTIAGGRFRRGRATPLHGTVVSATPMPTQFGQFADLHPDGERLAVALPLGFEQQPSSGDATPVRSTVILIQNFVDDLRRRMRR